MMSLPQATNTLLIRTEFAYEGSWQALLQEVGDVEEPFVFDMCVVNDVAYAGATVEQIVASLPVGYPHEYVVIADQITLTGEGYPLLIASLESLPMPQFRAIAREVAAMDNNLSIADMGFEEFAEMVDADGIYRGLSEG